MSLDLVVPAYNEQDRIGRTLRLYRRGLGGPDVRFVVALDGASDGTAEVVRQHRREDERVVLLELPRLGKGGVVREAFRHCDGDVIGFVDADAATPPEEVQRLVDATRVADGAIASRRHPASVVPGRRSLRRQLASAGFAALVRRLFGLPFADTQCGAKVFRREVVRRVLPLLSSRGFEFDVEFLSVAVRLGYEIVEVPSVWIDQEGSRVRLTRDAPRMAGSSLVTWANQRLTPGPERTDGPLRPRVGA